MESDSEDGADNNRLVGGIVDHPRVRLPFDLRFHHASAQLLDLRGQLREQSW